MLWKEMTSMNIPEDDIMQVVYVWDYETFNALLQTNQPCPNAFGGWLLENQNKDALELLRLAKRCETVRAETISPWYYAYEGDEVQVSLQEITKSALEYKGGRLLDRYTLQAVRALFSMEKYLECIQLWNARKDIMPNGLIKQMIESYVAGSYYHTGEEKKALELYAECGDYSYFYLKYMVDEKNSLVEGIRKSLKQFPNVLWYDEILQREVLRIDNDDWFMYYYDERRQSKIQERLRLYNDLFELAQEALSNKEQTHADIWYYTAAYMADKLDKMNFSMESIRKAEQVCRDDSLKASIQVFKNYVTAKMMPVNSQYDQWLYQALKWYERQIKDNLSEELMEYCLTWEGNKEVYYYNSALDRMKGCYSFYYWNDMMRKLLISVIAPKYVVAGKGERAIQLVNMADNMLMKVVEEKSNHLFYTMKEYRSGRKQFNSYDYSNRLFTLLDSVSIPAIIQYTKKITQPENELDQLINKYSYTNLDYFNEIIGTRYLRATNYRQATNYFEKVSSTFQYDLNTYKEEYMVRDPFEQEHKLQDASDYKLSFARQMLELEESISRTKDPNRKAQQLIKYAVGMRNSFDKCWALTYYGKQLNWEEVNGEYVIVNRLMGENIEKRYQQLTNQAFDLFTDSEAAAQAYWLLGYYKKVVRDYPNTTIADYAISHCDCLADYVAQRE